MEHVHETTYRFLPLVFIHRFIVKAKDFAQVEDMWQSGIYLQYQGQFAVVEANFREKKIIIRCNTAAKELVTAIQEEMEAINQNTSIKALEGEGDFIEEHLRKGFERLKDKDKTPIHSPMKKEINIFVSYSSKDRALREILVEGLREHLHHRKDFEYKLWADDGIDLGADWQQKIKEALEKSDTALLLVSASFASSKFINAEELPAFFRKKKEEGFLVMPVLLRQFDFEHFEQISALNFFKTYNLEYGFKKPTERNKLLPFDKLGDNDNTTDEKLNLYYSKLAGFIHTAVENHFWGKN